MAGGTVVGLDIGSNLIKVVEMKRSGNRCEVTAMDVAPTPQEAFENSVIIDAQILGKAVKELLAKARISARKSVSSVGGQTSVVVRVIEVPQMKESELADTMKWEVERQVPFPASEVVMDYKEIDRPEGLAPGQNMEVLLAVAQQDMIDRHVDMLKAAGLKPAAIDVEPLAVGRALLDLDGQERVQGYTVAIINIGATNTDVGVFRDKLIAFPRTLPIAGDNLTRAIAELLMVDIETAEKYKREYGEVMLESMQQPAGFAGGGETGLAGGGFAGGGFMDFSTPPPVTNPTGPIASPSGRMPFDFSTPGEAPPVPAPFDPGGSPSTEQPSPFDFAGGQPSGATSPSAELGFMSSSEMNIPPPADNLPVPVQNDIDPMKIQVFNAMAGVLAELVQEIRRSLDYYRGRATDVEISEILLTGGTAKLKNLAPFLQAELGIPTRVADPLLLVNVSTKNYSPAHLAEISSLFPICIGLGARELINAPSTNKGGKKRR